MKPASKIPLALITFFFGFFHSRRWPQVLREKAGLGSCLPAVFLDFDSCPGVTRRVHNLSDEEPGRH